MDSWSSWMDWKMDERESAAFLAETVFIATTDDLQPVV